jgi:transposase InsO family protein
MRVQKKHDQEGSIPELLRRAAELGVLEDGAKIDRVTVWRACQRMGLALGRVRSKRDTAKRRFAYAHRHQMVLTDGKHFRAGARRSKRVALFYLDDATRRGLRAVVGTAESSALYLRGLFEVVRRHGLMDAVYLDRGPGFIADDTQRVLAQLSRLLVLGRARYPEGHGKIERFNFTAWASVLRGLEAPDVDDDCGALELRLNHFLEQQYNLQPHESLEGRSPLERWEADERPLVWPESEASLREAFVLAERRKVSADNVVRFEGGALETPRGHADTWVVLRRNVLDGALWLPHDGRLVRLHPVDLVANARARRGSPEPDEPPCEPPVTAAALAFQRDFGAVVDADGGCLDPLPQEE